MKCKNCDTEMKSLGKDKDGNICHWCDKCEQIFRVKDDTQEQLKKEDSQEFVKSLADGLKTGTDFVKKLYEKYVDNKPGTDEDKPFWLK